MKVLSDSEDLDMDNILDKSDLEEEKGEGKFSAANAGSAKALKMKPKITLKTNTKDQTLDPRATLPKI
jgi:hypothetical protein